MRQSCVNKMQYHWPCSRILALNQNKSKSKGKEWSFLSQFLVCIYRLKFDAFFYIDNFVDNWKILIFDINNLLIIWKMPIYRQLIIFSDIIAHPYPRTENVQSFGTILALMAYLLDAYPLTDLRKGSFRTSLLDDFLQSSLN